MAEVLRVARGGGRDRRRLLALALVADMVILAPVLVTISQAVRGGWSEAARQLTASNLPALMVDTILVAVPATVICGAVGLATAWCVERVRLPGRRVWEMLLVAPVTVPPFVASYAWVSVGSAMQGYLGAVTVTSMLYYPLVYLLVAAALRGLDPALEESARSLGCGRWRTFVRVVLPQLRPALAGGMLLVALDALVELDAFVALKFQTFSTDVYAQFQTSFSIVGASVLSCVSIVLCVVLLSGESAFRRGANYTRISQGARRAVARYDLGRWKPAVLGGLGIVVGAALGVPIGTLVYWFTQSSSSALHAAAASTRFLLPAAGTSIALGVAAALVGVLLALPVALLVTRYIGRSVTLIERGTYLSYALPDLVGAIALAYAATHWVHPLYETLPLLVVAYAILFVPLAVVAMRATLGQLEPRMEESARSLGLGPLRSLWRVTLPVARPGLAAAFVLVFAFVIGDLSTTQVLLPPGMYNLATQFWTNSSTVAFAAAAPYAAVLIGLSMFATYVLMSRFGRLRALDAG